MNALSAPSGGAAGQIDVTSPLDAKEPDDYGIAAEGDDRPTVSAGSQEHGANSPSHGAAGGSEIPFGTHGAPPSVSPGATAQIGLTTKDPEFGTR